MENIEINDKEEKKKFHLNPTDDDFYEQNRISYLL